MVTKGPVFWIRFEWAPIGSDFIDDIWVQTSFVAASALLLAVCWPRSPASERILWQWV